MHNASNQVHFYEKVGNEPQIVVAVINNSGESVPLSSLGIAKNRLQGIAATRAWLPIRPGDSLDFEINVTQKFEIPHGLYSISCSIPIDGPEKIVTPDSDKNSAGEFIPMKVSSSIGVGFVALLTTSKFNVD